MDQHQNISEQQLERKIAQMEQRIFSMETLIAESYAESEARMREVIGLHYGNGGDELVNERIKPIDDLIDRKDSNIMNEVNARKTVISHTVELQLTSFLQERQNNLPNAELIGKIGRFVGYCTAVMSVALDTSIVGVKVHGENSNISQWGAMHTPGTVHINYSDINMLAVRVKAGVSTGRMQALSRITNAVAHEVIHEFHTQNFPGIAEGSRLASQAYRETNDYDTYRQDLGEQIAWRYEAELEAYIFREDCRRRIDVIQHWLKTGEQREFKSVVGF